MNSNGALLALTFSLFTAAPMNCVTAWAQTPEWTSTFYITAAYHTDIADEHADWNQAIDQLLSDMTKHLALDDVSSVCEDVAGCVLFQRPLGEDVGFFANPGHDIVDTEQERLLLWNWLDYHYKIVDLISAGVGEYGESGIAPNLVVRSVIVEAAADADTWAHEFGHNQGILDNSVITDLDADGHRRDFCKNAVMYVGEDRAAVRDVIDARERSFFIANPDAQDYRCGTVATTPALLDYFVATAEGGGCAIRFKTVWETEVEAFKVYKKASGVLVLLDTLIPTGGGQGAEYVVADPGGQEGDIYHLFDYRGPNKKEMHMDMCEATGPAQPPPPPWWDPDSVLAIVSSYADPGIAPITDCEEVPRYAIFCPDSFATALQSYVSLWNARSVDARIITTSHATACFGGIKQCIAYGSTRGLEYALLVGDASDADLWGDPSAWVSWPGWSWPGYPGDSSRNVIPTFYFMHHDVASYWSMTFWTPYYSSDLPYADVDDDGLGDVFLGRLPVDSVEEVAAYTEKLRFFLESTGNVTPGNLRQVGVAVDAAPAVAGYEAEWYMDMVWEAVPENVQTSRYYIRGRPEDVETVKTGMLANVADLDLRAASNYAANFSPGVLVWQDTSTDRYTWCGWGLFWSTNELATSHNPFISLGLSCGMANYDMNQDNVLTPLSERILLDPGKGAVVHIGPSRGSYQRGTGYFGAEFVKLVFGPGVSVGKAFRDAQRECTVKFPEYRDLYRELVLLGDPLVGAGFVVTEVREKSESGPRKLSVRSVSPNPFSGQMFAVVKGKAHEVVEVRLFDVSGRLVKELGVHKADAYGEVKAVWDGMRNDGVAARSGIYFLVCAAGREKSTAKVVLVR